MNYSLFLRLSYHYFIELRTQQETNAIVRLHNANGEKQFTTSSIRIIEIVKCSLYIYDLLNCNFMAYSCFSSTTKIHGQKLNLKEVIP